MKRCLICNKNEKHPACFECKKNPFNVEKVRQKLAVSNDLNLLRKTYESSYTEIKNLNTRIFWNERLTGNDLLSTQDGMTRERVKTAASFYDLEAGRILDIGVGNGYLEELLSKNPQTELVGIDISDEALQNIKKRFKGKFLKQSIYSFNFANSSFDAVFALEILEHIPPSKIFSSLASIYKLLKKDGAFILSVPMNEDLENMDSNPNGHVRDYTRELIFSELKLAGFIVERSKEIFAFKSYYELKTLLRKTILKKRWKPNNIVIRALKK